MVCERFRQIRIDGGYSPHLARDVALNFNPGAGTGNMRVWIFPSQLFRTPPP